jgi:membrane protein implicated in regulation of membrane protease activity
MVYKFRFRGSTIRDNRIIIIFLGSAAAFSYAVSLVLYEFALPMIMLLILSIALATFSVGRRIDFMKWLWVEFAILPLVLVSFMLLSIPTFAQANENITGTIGVYEKQVYQNLPTGMAHTLDDFKEPRYSSLEDLQSAINQSLNISSIAIFENAGG